jgi:hypothetical protein
MVIETPIEDTPDESAEPKVSEGSEEISEAVQDAQAPPEKAEPKKRGRPKKTEPPPEPKKKPGRPKKDSAQAPSERSSQPPTQAPSERSSQPPVLSASHEDPFRATLDTMSSAALVAELVNRRRASERQMKQELYRSFVM